MDKKNKIITNETMDQLTTEATVMICATDNGFVLKGSTPNILSLYSAMTREMLNLNHVTKEDLDRAYKMSFMNEDELPKLLDETMDKSLDKLLDSMLKELTELKEKNKKSSE